MAKLTDVVKVFIGYDGAESVAYHVLCQSILKHARQPVEFIPIKQTMLTHVYNRERDPKQSNEFSFTRFLVPYLCGYVGKAIFMDLDMLLRVDIAELWNHPSLFSNAISVVKHDYEPKPGTKYLGNEQHNYPRKNWSSVMLFNCDHSDCKKLTPEYVNSAPALELHRLNWARDSMIGELEPEWNWLVGEYDYNGLAKIVHFTIGGPYFYEYADCDYAAEWRIVHRQANFCLQTEQMVPSRRKGMSC